MASAPASTKDFSSFVSLVWEQGRSHARHELPWRFVDDPYAVYISELMLQQTQVSRVLKYWSAWMKEFPSIDALAAASTSDVLERWQGLGYNRRALSCHRTACICSTEHAGVLPDSEDELRALPGIGPATAAGITAFARQRPAVYIETNVRTVFIHHFFPDQAQKVSDKDLAPLVAQSCSIDDPRGWYYALLDYGSYLKAAGANAAVRSKSYSRQSKFEGSLRQKRSFVVREVLASPGVGMDELFALLNAEEASHARPEVSGEVFSDLVESLANEGFFKVDAARLYP